MVIAKILPSLLRIGLMYILHQNLRDNKLCDINKFQDFLKNSFNIKVNSL